jgi:MOSC domain-containing protein YiiM
MIAARIFSIVYQPAGGARDPGDRFERIPLDAARLRADHGIEGDRKAGKSPLRQLNLLSHGWLEQRRAEGYRAEPGAFGEQIVIAGLVVEALAAATRIRLGAEAVIELTLPRNGCARLGRAHGLSGQQPWAQVGMLARVITGGVVRVGDPVVVT